MTSVREVAVSKEQVGQQKLIMQDPFHSFLSVQHFSEDTIFKWHHTQPPIVCTDDQHHIVSVHENTQLRLRSPAAPATPPRLPQATATQSVRTQRRSSTRFGPFASDSLESNMFV